MEWELSNGYSLCLMKLKGNKYPTLLIRRPESNEFIAVGSIKTPELLKQALSFYGGKEKNNVL
jgi:hypothetical protein